MAIIIHEDVLPRSARPVEVKYTEQECLEVISHPPDSNFGYPRITRNGLRTSAHRWAYTSFVGDIPEGMQVLHRCDNPKCINVDHLFLGTPLDNMRDKCSKGRDYDRRGERSHTAKLTASDVVSIRNLSGGQLRQRDIAELFGVAQSSINNILSGKTWFCEEHNA